jgi:alanine racemase
VALEDEVVLLGRQGEEQITAEQMASWAQTINYEIVTRADPHAPRNLKK